MPKFRKRPVVIEAEQFVIYPQNSVPLTKTIHGITYPVYKDDKGYHIIISGLEGHLRCDNLDWVIKGVHGEPYSCKPDIFEKSYESVE